LALTRRKPWKAAVSIARVWHPNAFKTKAMTERRLKFAQVFAFLSVKVRQTANVVAHLGVIRISARENTHDSRSLAVAVVVFLSLGLKPAAAQYYTQAP
jgi:hypothetical protein